MTIFAYDGSAPDYPHQWRAVGMTFPTGVAIEVTEAQARKLRCLPYFREAPCTGFGEGVALAVVDEAGSTCLEHRPNESGTPLPDSERVEPAPEQKRKPGRPKGSKNRPKVSDGN